MTQNAVGSAVRNLRRAPAFTGLVVLTLALGIGATTAMFSVVDALLLNPLPFPNADRFGEVWTIPEKGSGRAGSTTAVLNALKRESDLFAAVGGWQFGSAVLTDGGDPEIQTTPQISPEMLAILNVRPVLGDWFRIEDAAAGDRVLLSEQLWVSRFGADPLIVGKTITLDDRPHRVVGVMPARFRFPRNDADMWRALDTTPRDKPAFAQVITVRRAELTRAQINDRLQAMTPQLRESATIRATDSLKIDNLMQLDFGRRSSTALYILFGAVALVMLVACVNVMNLLLARASARSGELALMSALGASRARLVRDVLIESALLAAAAAATGLALGRGLLVMILNTAPQNLTTLTSATSDIDARALMFALALAAVTCVVFTVLPAWRALRIDAIETLKQRGASVAGSRDDWWQGALVAGQLALVVVLLTGAALLLRSFGQLLNVDPGFVADELAVVEVSLPANRYGAPGAGLAFMQELEQKVEETGLRGTITGGAPPRGGGVWFDIEPETDDGRKIDLGQESLWYSGIRGDYFSVMGIRLVEGRTFEASDPPNVAVLGAAMATRFFGESGAVGRRYRLSEKQPWTTVIGVVAEVKLLGPNEPKGDSMEFYQPFSPTTRNTYFSFVVRAPAQHGAALQLVRQKVWELDAKVPIVSASTMPDRLADSIARPRFYLTLSSAFAITGALMAAVGVYGISVYWVSRRKHELAIRIAIGASREKVMRMVLVRGLRLAAIGTIAGLAMAIGGTRLIESMLFQTSGRDPATLIAVTVLLAVLVLVGSVVPAMRAARVDPMTTLRAE